MKALLEYTLLFPCWKYCGGVRNLAAVVQELLSAGKSSQKVVRYEGINNNKYHMVTINETESHLVSMPSPRFFRINEMKW